VISTGTVIVLVAFIGLFVPQRIFQRILMVGVGLGLAAWVGILTSFSALPAGTFEALWNQTHGTGNNFSAVIPAAQALGFMSSPVPDFSMAGLAIGLWLFFGFISTTQLGGEVRKPENAILGGSTLALAVSAAVFVVAVVVMGRAIPPEWMAAQSFLNQNPAYIGETTSYITYYTGLVFPNLPLLLLVFWGWVLSFVVLIQAYITFMGRVMLAWADDGLLPEGMAYVHPRFRSPLVTLLLAAILVQLGLMAFFVSTPSSLQARFGFFSSAVLLVPVIAVTFFPFLKKAWFQSSPAFVQRKIGPLPLVTLTGFISMVYLVFLLIRPLLTPGDSASVSIGDLLVLGAMVLSGIFWYVGRRMHRQAHGVHLEEVMRNLPRGS
jgi:amino acid transporter